MTIKRVIPKTTFYFSISVLTIIWLTPLIFLLFTSLKSSKGFYTQPVFAFPDRIYFENFINAFKTLKRYIFNDLIICFIKVPLGIFISTMAAFALTRLKIKYSISIFSFFLIGLMIPHEVTLVPLNLMLNRLHLRNTYLGLIYVYLGFGIPFAILVMRGFMSTIPKEIDESATIDGANKWKLLISIILPICKPAISTLAILDFLSTWNEYILGSVLVTKDSMRTISAGLARFSNDTGTDYPRMCAGVLICMIPTLLVYLIFQKNFVEGVSGAVKG